MNETKMPKLYPYARHGVRCMYCREWFRLRTPDEVFDFGAHLLAERGARHVEDVFTERHVQARPVQDLGASK